MNGYALPRPKIFEWSRELDVLQKSALSFVFACFIGLLAQIRFYLPFTPVPITGQTFGILLGAIILGKTWGGVSAGMYVGAGVAGIPWFSGMTGGMGTLTGATGGYLMGFIIASFVVGYAVDKYGLSRNFSGMLVLLFFANFVIIYGIGLAHLYLWLSFVGGTSVGILELLVIGAAPFVIGDIFKLTIVSSVANWFTPKKAMG